MSESKISPVRDCEHGKACSCEEGTAAPSPITNSDEEPQKCPICLDFLDTQQVGTPDCCQHVFCCSCLQEWCKMANTCPVDRKRFDTITVRCCVKGAHCSIIPAMLPRHDEDEDQDEFLDLDFDDFDSEFEDFESEDSEFEDFESEDSEFEDFDSEDFRMICEICGSSNDEEGMLFCAGCSCASHLDCQGLLLDVEQEDWLCHECIFLLT